MEPKDIVSLVISVLSACISVISVLIARNTIDKQRIMQGWITNHDLLTRASGVLIADHSLLRILGIEHDELINDGITASEIIFINTSLDASSAFHRVFGERHVALTEYRKKFLRSAKVRTAWKKYLRHRTFSPSPWTEAVDAFIADFESKGGGSRAKAPT